MLLNGLLLIFVALTLSTQAMDDSGRSGRRQREALTRSMLEPSFDPGQPPSIHRSIEFIVSYADSWNPQETIIAFKHPINVESDNLERYEGSWIQTLIPADQAADMLLYGIKTEDDVKDHGMQLNRMDFEDTHRERRAFPAAKGYWSLLWINKHVRSNSRYNGIIRVKYLDGQSPPIDITPIEKRYKHPSSTQTRYLRANNMHLENGRAVRN